MAFTSAVQDSGGSTVGASAAEFQRKTEEIAQAQMVVTLASVSHSGKSALANATGQLGSQFGQDIRAAARQT